MRLCGSCHGVTEGAQAVTEAAEKARSVSEDLEHFTRSYEEQRSETGRDAQ